jgi:23S rRNA maturation-related 3'-5' exoribonuclease YhaM
LLEKIRERERDVRRFEEFLRAETAWATAPASTRFHLARPGGLVEHSVNVARTLLRLRESLAPELSEESCVIVALYHDTGKAGTAGRPYYLPNPDAWQVRNRGVRYVINRDLPHMDIASRSLMLVSRFVPLSDEEAQAIRYHDGQYIEENRSVAHRETKLTRLLQYADNWSGGVIEADAE